VPPRRPQHTDRPSYWSDARAISASSREVARGSSGSSYAIEEEPIPLKTRTSSTSDRARKILDFSNIVNPSLVNNTEQVPREAKAGFKWKRDFSGGSLEVRVGRQSEPDGGRSKAHSEYMTLPLGTATTTHRRSSDTMTIAKSRSQNTDERLLPEPPEDNDTVSTLGPLREGLYCRTKRALGLKHGPITPYVELRTWTPTGAVLDRVTSTLRFLPSRASSVSTSAATSVSNLSIAGTRKERHGRRNVLNSSSSSVRNLLMGKPPAGTPEPEAMYTGSDSKKYLSVDMTEHYAPAFLPSEARRIHTPPLPSGGSGKRGSRGFFFDYNAPAEEHQKDIPKQISQPTKADDINSRPTGNDWYRIQLDTIDDSREVVTREAFATTIPEHLPSSPLCPRNPKHKAGGTGTCPYHGRNKSTPSDVDLTPTLGQTGTLSPVLGTWWMK